MVELVWKSLFTGRIFAALMTFEVTTCDDCTVLCESKVWITPPEFTATVSCNHVIATCHSMVHCVLLDIWIKFHCKFLFKRPKLGIKTKIWGWSICICFSPRWFQAPNRSLWGGVFFFTYFQSPKQNVALGHHSSFFSSSFSSSCCSCCLLWPQWCLVWAHHAYWLE